MKTIYKYPLPNEDSSGIPMPIGADILHVGLDTEGTPCVWALVNPDATKAVMQFEVFREGYWIPPRKDYQCRVHLGSFPQGLFMWHVFFLAVLSMAPAEEEAP